ncbi:MAG: alpha/beta fold hydrolase [Acidobacteriota bacterium]
MNLPTPRRLLLGAGALLAATLPAQEPLTLERIMAHPDWIGRAPEAAFWSRDDAAVYFSQKQEGSTERTLFRIALDGSGTVALSDAEAGQIASSARRLTSSDGRRHLFVRHGDLFLEEAGALRQLTRTRERESAPLFLNGGAIAYQRGGQTYVRDLQTGLESQPFHHSSSDDPAVERKKELAKANYLRDQQSRLFDWVREREARTDTDRERALARRRADPTQAPPTVYLGKGRNVRTQLLAPTAQHLFLVTNTSNRGDGQRTKMPRYVTSSGFTEVDDVRTKVGGPQTGDQLWMLASGAQEPVELDLGALPQITDDPLAELKAAAKARAAKPKDGKGEGSAATEEEKASDPKAAEPKTRDVRFSGGAWSADGSLFAGMLVSTDNKDRWIVAVDGEGKVTPVHHVRDEAWTNWRYRTLGWIPDQQALYFLSEESGYSQLYRADLAGSETRLAKLTEGEFVVSSVTLTRTGDWAYFTANPDHPGHYDVYRVPSSPGPHTPERLTELGGLTSYVLSPDESKLLLTHSKSTRPPELFVQTIETADVAQLTTTVSAEFADYAWIEPESVQVPSSHVERSIYGRLYHDGQTEGKPTVVFVHGAGYLQNAHLGWSSYFREFMFHSLLVQQGYVVLDLDYRASAGYGRDWRTAIYRQMGTPEVEDLRDGVEWLVDTRGIDPKRVGVYGGSYGGFLTFMAMFRDPDLFASGAALRPVTDWAHYNHPYTSNILNTPEVDPEAYERSSPIEFAEGLRKPLLIATGMLDDNVHFQDSVRLVQKLIELEKEDWEIAIYPVERHGFVEPSSWLDEYRRIFKLFEETLK